MRLARARVSYSIACASSSFAQVADGPTRTFQGRDIFSLRAAGDPQVRAMAGAVALRADNLPVIMTDNGHPSIWLADPVTGAQTPLV